MIYKLHAFHFHVVMIPIQFLLKTNQDCHSLTRDCLISHTQSGQSVTQSVIDSVTEVSDLRHVTHLLVTAAIQYLSQISNIL